LLALRFAFSLGLLVPAANSIRDAPALIAPPAFLCAAGRFQNFQARILVGF
jgi:hypothetical protein